LSERDSLPKKKKNENSVIIVSKPHVVANLFDLIMWNKTNILKKGFVHTMKVNEVQNNWTQLNLIACKPFYQSGKSVRTYFFMFKIILHGA